MTPITIKSLFKSYLLTLLQSTISLFLLFAVFNDIITADGEGPIVYFIFGTVMLFLFPLPVIVFFLLPLSLIEEKRIMETPAAELIKRYLPIPVFIFSAPSSAVVLLAKGDYNFVLFFLPLVLHIFSISINLLCTYIHQLKS